MQVNLSLSSNIVMGLLIVVVGLIQVYKGVTKEVPSFKQSESSLDLLSSMQESKTSGEGPQMVQKMDSLVIISGLLLVIVGVMKAFFNKNQ